MRITRYTDYSLRVLIYVAMRGETLSTIREISESYEISRNHLMKVVHQLNLNGYLETVRGKHGGIRLRQRPEEINVGQLVRVTERDLALVECMGEEDNCVISPVCKLKHVMAEALEAFLSVLDRYTLQDLLPTSGQEVTLQHLLRIDIPVVHERV